MIPSWARLEPILDLSWGILGPSWAKDRPSWAHLGPCGGILEPSGRLREGILRQKQGLEALTWSLHVARKPQIKTSRDHSKTKVFQRFLGAGTSIKHAKMALRRSGCGLEDHLAGFGSHVVVNGAAESQHHPFLGPSWTDVGASWHQVGAKMGLLRCVFYKFGPFWRPPGPSWPYL